MSVFGTFKNINPAKGAAATSRTDSMSPEEVAKKVIAVCKSHQDSWFWAENMMAAAIRQTENEALDLAARHVSGAPASFDRAKLVSAILDLKSKG